MSVIHSLSAYPVGPLVFWRCTCGGASGQVASFTTAWAEHAAHVAEVSDD